MNGGGLGWLGDISKGKITRLSMATSMKTEQGGMSKEQYSLAYPLNLMCEMKWILSHISKSGKLLNKNKLVWERGKTP